MPDEVRIGTSRVERNNWTIRTHLRRFVRLSNGFSRKRRNLQCAFAIYAVYHNFIKTHTSIRMPPAVKAGVTRKPWTVGELLDAVAA